MEMCDSRGFSLVGSACWVEPVECLRCMAGLCLLFTTLAASLLRMVLQGGKGESPRREENGQGAWGFPLKELI